MIYERVSLSNTIPYPVVHSLAYNIIMTSSQLKYSEATELQLWPHHYSVKTFYYDFKMSFLEQHIP